MPFPLLARQIYAVEKRGRLQRRVHSAPARHDEVEPRKPTRRIQIRRAPLLCRAGVAPVPRGLHDRARRDAQLLPSRDLAGHVHVEGEDAMEHELLGRGANDAGRQQSSGEVGRVGVGAREAHVPRDVQVLPPPRERHVHPHRAPRVGRERGAPHLSRAGAHDDGAGEAVRPLPLRKVLQDCLEDVEGQSNVAKGSWDAALLPMRGYPRQCDLDCQQLRLFKEREVLPPSLLASDLLLERLHNTVGKPQVSRHGLGDQVQNERVVRETTELLSVFRRDEH
mmetsp:Transcript_26714/g.58623  ORF Transcript_26714/g.58623 Transcript_26714/m.58623 type:complete len:280 (+) Transcript_26714:274-1113(+)